jgi:hypothetical protein
MLKIYSEKQAVYHCDEATFSKNTLKKSVWALPGQEPPTESTEKYSFKSVAVTAAIDQNGKIVAVEACPKAVTINKFIEFLKLLRSRITAPKILLTLDNLPVHHSLRV